VPDQGVVGPDSTTRSLPGAFLNIPYDVDFQSLYLAYIAGITAFGLRPRATLEIPGIRDRHDISYFSRARFKGLMTGGALCVYNRRA